MAPKKDEDGKLALSLPMGDKKLPGIAVEDIGKSAYEIFKKGEPLQTEGYSPIYKVNFNYVVPANGRADVDCNA